MKSDKTPDGDLLVLTERESILIAFFVQTKVEQEPSTCGLPKYL